MGRRTLAAIVTAVLVLSAAAPAIAAVAAPAGAPEGDVQHFLDEQTVVRGFFRGRTVRYLDLGAVKLAPGNRWPRSGWSRTGRERSETSSTSSQVGTATRRCGASRWSRGSGVSRRGR